MANSIKEPANRTSRYHIKVKGKKLEHWCDWLNGMDISIEKDEFGSPVTTVIGTVPDQAALRGILCKFWNLNLTILSVSQIEMKTSEEEAKNE